MRFSRIYLAGGSTERLAIHEWRKRLGAEGFLITHDWTQGAGYSRAPLPGQTPDETLTRSEQSEAAKEEMQGVRSSTLAWFLVPKQVSEGMHFELGYATAYAIHRIGSGPYVGRSIFHTQLDAAFPTHEEAFAWICREANNGN